MIVFVLSAEYLTITDLFLTCRYIINVDAALSSINFYDHTCIYVCTLASLTSEVFSICTHQLAGAHK